LLLLLVVVFTFQRCHSLRQFLARFGLGFQKFPELVNALSHFFVDLCFYLFEILFGVNLADRDLDIVLRLQRKVFDLFSQTLFNSLLYLGHLTSLQSDFLIDGVHLLLDLG